MKAKLLQRAREKEAAPRSIWFHGTYFKNLRSILTQGLIPQVKEKSWNEDPDAGTHAPSRESYGGIYVTRNVMTALGAPRNWYRTDGRMIMVVMELQPNTFYLDEDDVNFTLNGALGRLSDHFYSVECAWVAATQLDSCPKNPENQYQEYTINRWREGTQQYRDEYVQSCMKSFEYKFSEYKEEMHGNLRARLTEVLQKMWLPALTRLAVHFFKQSQDYGWKRVYCEVTGSPYDEVPAREATLPPIGEAEADYMKHAEQVTRTLRLLARPIGDSPRYRDTARVTTPIGFSGSNRITCVAEIREGKQFRGEDPHAPVPVVLHYGTLPEDFYTQWRERQGTEIQVTKPSKTAAEHEVEADDADFNEDGYWAGDGGGASGILPICSTTKRICLAWRNEEVHQGSCWGTLGGAVKTGKSPADSAREEMAEEVGFHGDMALYPAYVFRDKSFSYHNFIGVTKAEFSFNPKDGHSWETDAIEWVRLDDLREDMQAHPADYHPGLISLFEHSAELIERFAGGGPEPEGKTASVTPAEIATLKNIESRAGEEFRDWMRDLVDDDQEFDRQWADDDLRLSYLDDYLREEHQISVREDGACTFWKATPEVEHLIGDLPVIVFHHTSSGLLPQIKREGLRAGTRKSNSYQNSGAGVYVTTEVAGPAVEGYKRNAVSRRKGNPVTLEIRTTLDQLHPDPDDADIVSGEVQFVLPYVPPQDIEFPKKPRRHRAAAAPVQDITQTPEFKRWFAGSKVVDAQGRPMVMYHATQTGDIEEFRPFTHFGTQQAANDRHNDLWSFYNDTIKNPARAVGSNIMPVFLSVKNPLRLPDLAGIDDRGRPLDDEPEDDFDSGGDERFPRGWEEEEAIAMTLLERGIINIDEFEEVRGNDEALKLLAEKGYDGIVYKNVVEDPGNDSWIVFNPNQIKSAIGNGGGFDPESKKITAAAETPVQAITETPEFKRWFAGSKIVDAGGKPLKVYHGTTKNFEQFGGRLSWFTDDASYANGYAHGGFVEGGLVMPCYLSIKNPYDARQFGYEEMSTYEWADLMKLDHQWARDEYGSQRNPFWYWFAITPKAREVLIDEGHDGVILLEQEMQGPHKATAYVAFYPNQIKSALGNNGQFDPESNSVTASGPVTVSPDGQYKDYQLSMSVVEPEDDRFGERIYKVTADYLGNSVGSAEFREDGRYLYPEHVGVAPQHQRKGLATAMYTFAQRELGMAITPSTSQTSDGRALWSQPERPFGMEASKTALDVKETPVNQQHRERTGYTEIVNVDAAKFKALWEAEHGGEKLDWNPKRLEKLKPLRDVNDHPRVYADSNGRLDVLDGRHRITESARRGEPIEIAVPPGTVVPEELLVSAQAVTASKTSDEELVADLLGSKEYIVGHKTALGAASGTIGSMPPESGAGEKSTQPTEQTPAGAKVGKIPVLGLSAEEYAAAPNKLIDELESRNIGDDPGRKQGIGLRGIYKEESGKTPRRSWHRPDGIPKYRLNGTSTVGITGDYFSAPYDSLVDSIRSAFENVKKYGDTDYVALLRGDVDTEYSNDIGEAVLKNPEVIAYIRKTGPSASDKSSAPASGAEEPAAPSGKTAAVDMTQTPEFKRWFAGSKAVEADGSPTVMYHGAEKVRSVFKPQQGKRYTMGIEYTVPATASFFTPDREFAKTFGNALTAVYLRILKPLDLREGAFGVPDQKTYEILKDHFGEQAGFVAPGDLWEILDEPHRVESIRALGYDSVIFMERDKSGQSHETYAVFEPTQIKSARRNSGKFDPESARITASAEEVLDPTPLGRAVRRFCRTSESFRILDTITPDADTWTSGGCWILADAICRGFGGELYAVWGLPPQTPKESLDDPIRPQHVVVKAGSYYIDADGASTEQQLIARWANLEGVHQAVIGSIDESRLNQTEFPRPGDPATIIDAIRAQMKASKRADQTEEPEFDSWIGVDLDGTFAMSLDDYSDPTRIGEPIEAMVRKVKKAIEDGKTVKVFTARMADEEHADAIAKAIGDWTEECVGKRLEATCSKDPGCTEIWDDKARRVKKDEGKFAAQDITETPAFKAWFAGSKVVDVDGNPMTMYHGTKSAIDQFDEKMFGTSDEGWLGKGFYFTYNPEEASGYALAEMFGKGDAPNVLPVYISIKNPFVITRGVLPDRRTVRDLHEGHGITSKGGKAVRALAESGGHDGIIFANEEGKPLHVVAFRPNQIKSAIGNSGKFNPSDHSIVASIEIDLTTVRKTADNDKTPPSSIDTVYPESSNGWALFPDKRPDQNETVPLEKMIPQA